jgi:hypothetical protein
MTIALAPHTASAFPPAGAVSILARLGTVFVLAGFSAVASTALRVAKLSGSSLAPLGWGRFFRIANLKAIRKLRLICSRNRAAVAAEPQASGTAPFHMNMGPERVWGTFNLTRQEDADEMIKRITALKAFL